MRMSKLRFLLLIRFMVAAVALTVWLFGNQTQRRLMSAYRDSREAMVATLYGHYRNYLDSVSRAVSGLAQLAEESDSTDFGEMSTKLKEVGIPVAPLLRVWWLSPEGEILYSSPPSSQNPDFSSDPMFMSADQGAITDVYLFQGAPVARTICPVKRGADTYFLAVDSKLGPELFRGLQDLFSEDVVFLYGDKMVFSAGPASLTADFKLPREFLDSVRDKQGAGFAVISHEGKKYLAFAYPVLDFDEWDTKGFIALIAPEELVSAEIGRILWPLWLGGAAAILVLLAGALYTERWARRIFSFRTASSRVLTRWRMWALSLAFSLPLIAVYIYVSFFAVPPLMERYHLQRAAVSAREAELVWKSIVSPLSQIPASAPAQGDLAEYLEKLRAANGLDFAVLKSGGEIHLAGERLEGSCLESIFQGATGPSPQIRVCKEGAIVAEVEDTAAGKLGYGFSLSKDWLSQEEDRIGAGLTMLVSGKPLISTVKSRILRTLRITTHRFEVAGIVFKRGKLRDVYHELGFVPLFSQEGGSSPEAADALMVSVEDTPYQNNITGYHFTSLALMLVVLFIFGVSLFVILNADRPLLLHSVFTGYSFLSPALIHLFWWAVGPLLFAAYLAFHRWSIINPAKPFVGLGNFRELFHDSIFWHSMLHTVIYTLNVPIGMALSLAIALAVNRKVRGIKLLRTIYFLPAVSSLVVTSIMWRWIFNPDFGILNYILSFFGIPKLPWLTSPYMAMPAIMIMSIWMVMGQQMIIFLAGLQSIPSEYYDAASVDGANGFQRFWHITLPLLKPTTFFVLVTSVISSFQVFTPVYVLTQGGPVRSTDVAVYHIYQTAWQELRMGYASAQSWILFAAILIFTLIEFRMFGKEVRYV